MNKEMSEALRNLPLTDVLRLGVASVRLTNGLHRAAHLGQLPFANIEDYLKAGESATDLLMRIPGFGKGTVKELQELVGQLIKNPSSDEFVCEGNGDVPEDVLHALEVPFDEFLRNRLVSQRTRNAINACCAEGKCPFPSVAAYLRAGPRALQELRRIPNLGAKSAGELDKLIHNVAHPSRQPKYFDESGRPNVEEILENVKLLLSERESEVLRGRLAHGMTLEEVAGRVGVTRERIRQLEANALARIRLSHGGVLQETATAILALLQDAGHAAALSQISQSLVCNVTDLEFLLQLLRQTFDGFRQQLDIRGEHVLLSGNLIPEKQWDGEIKRIAYSAEWPISLENLFAELKTVPSYYVRDFLINKLGAVVEEGRLIRISRMRTSAKCVYALRRAKKPMHVSEIRARLFEVFGEDFEEHAIIATVGRLQEALIVAPATYALYEHIPYTQDELNEIRTTVHSYLRDKGRFISSKIIFESLFREDSKLFRENFNHYVMMGIVQDDARFVTKRGHMIGLVSFEVGKTFTLLEDEVRGLVDEHGPITLSDIMKRLSGTRKLCNDSGVRQILASTPEIIKVGPRIYDSLHRFFESREQYEQLVLAIRILLSGGSKSAYAILRELSRAGFPNFELDSVESILDSMDDVHADGGVYNLSRVDMVLLEYESIVKHALDQGVALKELELRVKEVFGVKQGGNLLGADGRLRAVPSAAPKDQNGHSEIMTILNEFDA